MRERSTRVRGGSGGSDGDRGGGKVGRVADVEKGGGAPAKNCSHSHQLMLLPATASRAGDDYRMCCCCVEYHARLALLLTMGELRPASACRSRAIEFTHWVFQRCMVTRFSTDSRLPRRGRALSAMPRPAGHAVQCAPRSKAAHRKSLRAGAVRAEFEDASCIVHPVLPRCSTRSYPGEMDGWPHTHRPLPRAHTQPIPALASGASNLFDLAQKKLAWELRLQFRIGSHELSPEGESILPGRKFHFRSSSPLLASTFSTAPTSLLPAR